ncbi:MAG: hypothetical protein ABSF71_12035 [Terriglobia bacterium]|jgi:hypothetical protein
MLLTASVECGKYLKADRGTLTLADGQLRFETGGRSLFDLPLRSIEKIVWHWYSFGGAFEATIAGQSNFISFVPRGAGLGVWYTGLSTARQWRAAFEGRPAPEGPPLAARLFMVVFEIAMIFILGCFALLSLGVAIDPASSILSRIFAGACAVVFGLTCIVLAGKGIKAIGATLCGKR